MRRPAKLSTLAEEPKPASIVAVASSPDVPSRWILATLGAKGSGFSLAGRR